MSLTYPLVIPVPGQIAFSAVVVSNLLIAPSCEKETQTEKEREREGCVWVGGCHTGLYKKLSSR